MQWSANLTNQDDFSEIQNRSGWTVSMNNITYAAYSYNAAINWAYCFTNAHRQCSAYKHMFELNTVTCSMQFLGAFKHHLTLGFITGWLHSCWKLLLVRFYWFTINILHLKNNEMKAECSLHCIINIWHKYNWSWWKPAASCSMCSCCLHSISMLEHYRATQKLVEFHVDFFYYNNRCIFNTLFSRMWIRWTHMCH